MKFAIQFVCLLFGGVLYIRNKSIQPNIWVLHLLILLMAAFALGFRDDFSALTIKYKDLSFYLPLEYNCICTL
jgi:ABC-type polysaccharide/polyol phosphate export permease